jgi:hypothetical protein
VCRRPVGLGPWNPDPGCGSAAHHPAARGDTAWPVFWFTAPPTLVTRCPICHRYWGVLLKPAGYQMARLG